MLYMVSSGCMGGCMGNASLLASPSVILLPCRAGGPRSRFYSDRSGSPRQGRHSRLQAPEASRRAGSAVAACERAAAGRGGVPRALQAHNSRASPERINGMSYMPAERMSLNSRQGMGL